jgi:ribonucleoside-diphosphate reductase alpha chain
LIEDEFFKPHETAVLSIPIKAPAGSIVRSETALELLARVKRVYQEWILPGHVKGSNTHNVSVTISVAPNEWEEVKTWMWENREAYSGISLLPKFESDHTYKQPPFSDITEEEFEQLAEGLDEIDLSVVVEYDDNTDLQGELACAGGACTVV